MTRNEGLCDVMRFPRMRQEPSSASVAWMEESANAVDSFPISSAKMHEMAGLNLERMYFPLGFPVRVVTNHASVLAAADRSWSRFRPAFHRSPLEILIEVHPDPVTIRVLPPAPNYKINGQLMVQQADAHNFTVADLRAGRALVRVTEMTARCLSYFCYHFLEGTALSMLATVHCVPIHGACVRVAAAGILICGDSGDGKSTLAFAGARAGWTYVSDDATYLPLERNDRLVVGNCHQVRFRPSATQLFPELRGRHITPRASGKPSIEVPTSEWPGLVCANAVFIDAIVFLNRRSADEQQLIPLQASAVCNWFKQHLIPTADSLDPQEAALARLLTASVFSLRYRDLPWGIERLQRLAENGD